MKTGKIEQSVPSGADRAQTAPTAPVLQVAEELHDGYPLHHGMVRDDVDLEELLE